MNRKEIVLAVSVVLLLVLVSGCPTTTGTSGSQPGGGKTGTQAAASPATEPQGPPVTVSAVQLAKDYRADKDAADGKYKNKILIVDGEVESGIKHVSGDPTFLLKGVKETIDGNFVFEPVQVFVKKEFEEKTAALKEAQKTKVKGKCVGKSVGIVTLLESEIVE